MQTIGEVLRSLKDRRDGTGFGDGQAGRERQLVDVGARSQQPGLVAADGAAFSWYPEGLPAAGDEYGSA